MDLASYLAREKRRIQATLEALLPAPEGPAATVIEAMRYAALGPGKRLRPILALAAFEACGGRGDGILCPAASLELIHAYSLIHDDLPSMDDDDLRRGRPTTHRVYGEAQAILAGDALLTLAFELLAAPALDETDPGRASESLRLVAHAAGIAGMVGGQAADLEAEGRDVDAHRLRWIHRHKTGALFSASTELGAVQAGAPFPQREALSDYGASLGLAFQILDDVLDETASSAELGKTAGKDARSGKATFPSLLGLEASRSEALERIEAALERLRSVDLLTEPLESLARYAVDRSR